MVRLLKLPQRRQLRMLLVQTFLQACIQIGNPCRIPGAGQGRLRQQEVLQVGHLGNNREAFWVSLLVEAWEHHLFRQI